MAKRDHLDDFDFNCGSYSDAFNKPKKSIRKDEPKDSGSILWLLLIIGAIGFGAVVW